MMSPQCGTCGAYYTGNESFCSRCGAPRVANPYQQNQFAQPAQQAGGGGWLQNYYTPQRIVQRVIIGRIIGLAVAVLIVGGCIACVLLGGLASVLGSH
ncbi:MAG TPA: hypothetical protein VH599_16355 [Ktedonobacterales bacterium]|jgi:hypothetical protein